MNLRLRFSLRFLALLGGLVLSLYGIHRQLTRHQSEIAQSETRQRETLLRELIKLETDDGTGFVPDRVPPGRQGQRNLATRAKELGATLQIQSAPGKGTTIVLHLPPGKPRPAPGSRAISRRGRFSHRPVWEPAAAPPQIG